MTPLKFEPPDAVRSLPEFFALAHALEDEAATRYAELATEMEALGLPRVAAAFRSLVEEERGHAHHVGEWSRDATGARPDPARLRWLPPDAFDEEAARSLVSSSLASAYRALSMAVRNEERAFALWAYIAARTEVPEIRRSAERMATEELRHAAMLRQERRRAYREERRDAAPRRPPLARAVAAERSLSGLLGAFATQAPSAAWSELAAEARGMAAEAARLAAEAALDVPPAAAAGGEGDLDEALRLSEEASDAYLDATDAAREDAQLGQLLSLSERAIARIARLRRHTAAGVPAPG